MTDTEIIQAQQSAIEKLQRQVKRLKKRLLVKKQYETDLLVEAGFSPKYLEGVDAKDRAALEEK